MNDNLLIKYENTLRWMEEHLTYVTPKKVENNCTWYSFCFKEGMEAKVGDVCEGLIVSTLEEESGYDYMVFLFDSESHLLPILHFNNKDKIDILPILDTECITIH